MRDNGLPRARVIRTRSLIRDRRRIGQRRTSRVLLLVEHPAATAQPDEAAFITPKRLGKAHDRNLLRRRMREVYRIYIGPQMRSSNHRCRLVWIAREPATKLSFQQLSVAMTMLAFPKKG